MIDMQNRAGGGCPGAVLTVVWLACGLAMSAGLAGCGGGADNRPPEAEDVSLTGARTWLPLPGTFAAQDPDGQALRISAIAEDGHEIAQEGGLYRLSHGTLEVRGLDFVYTPLSTAATRFAYTVSDGASTASATVQVAAALGDPLASQQWHLRNTGQTAYAMSESVVPTHSKWLQLMLGMPAAAADQEAAANLRPEVLQPGQDINVLDAYAQGITGQGVVAVVVDTGLEIRHEDLAANVLPGRSLNLIPGVADPTDPTSEDPLGDHGTSVAGLIAAVGWNGLGGRGVAPSAGLMGINFLAEQSALSEMLAHGHPGSGIGAGDPVAVFNRSYGTGLPLVIGYSQADETMQGYSATVLRGGRGAVNVKSAGNAFLGRGYEGRLCDDNGASTLGLSCYNANFDAANNSPYYTVVGAVNSDGRHTRYSSAGANLLVSAPAGEYGEFAPAMVTTDQSTCLRGYSSLPMRDLYDTTYFAGFFGGLFPFNNPGHADNASCNYTSTFNGTSSAAPNTAGVVALLLSANPSLGYRDVRDILVRTSTKVDAGDAPVSLDVAGQPFVAHAGWVKNAAGLEFNNNYGFGRVDAGRAVRMARAATPLGPARTTGWIGQGLYAAEPASLGLPVPDNSTRGATLTLEVTEDLQVESVQFKFTVTQPEFLGVGSIGRGLPQSTAGMDLAIEVLSPAGTRSVLLSSRQALVLAALSPDFFDLPGRILSDAVFLSNAFHGESARGTWTVRILDLGGSAYADTGSWLFGTYVNNASPSVVEGVALKVFGH